MYMEFHINACRLTIRAYIPYVYIFNKGRDYRHHMWRLRPNMTFKTFGLLVYRKKCTIHIPSKLPSKYLYNIDYYGTMVIRWLWKDLWRNTLASQQMIIPSCIYVYIYGWHINLNTAVYIVFSVMSVHRAPRERTIPIVVVVFVQHY